MPVFLIWRAWLWHLGLHPDIETVLEHWQYADLKLLDEDYWRTLWYLHSQPPLWNGIIGAVVNLAGNDAGRVTGILHLCFILISLLGWLGFAELFHRIGMSEPARAVLATVIVVSPSVLFYENYIFYPHFTWGLVVVFLLAAIRSRSGSSFTPAVIALTCLALLSWSWAIFHPAFVLVLGAGVLWAGHRLRQGSAIVLLLVTVLFSTLPVLKNIAITGTPSASSWIGINLSQTAVPFGSEKSIYCDLYLVHQDIWRRDPTPRQGLHASLNDTQKSSGHANFNHIEIAERAQECADIAVSAILENTANWVKGRLLQILNSHRLASYEYHILPDGWSDLSISRVFPEHAELWSRNLFAAHFAVLLLWAGWKSATGDQRRFYLLLLVLVLGFTFASHFANGAEQQRMRYTISPIYWFLLASMVHSTGQILSHVRRSTGDKKRAGD